MPRRCQLLPATVAAFLASEAHAGRRVSTITRRAAAIRYAHRLAGFETPTDAEAVKAVMRGIRRTIGTAPDRKAPATADIVGEMIHLCPANLRGTRDRALLTLGFAGAFRRSELVALTVADLTEARRRVSNSNPRNRRAIKRPTARRSPSRAATGCARSRPCRTGCSRRTSAKARCSARCSGRHASAAPATTPCRAGYRKRTPKRAGLDLHVQRHSCAPASSLSRRERSVVFKMMEVSRHKSVDTLRGYVRSAELFKEHAGSKFL